MEHLADADRIAYFSALSAGTDIDHRGTCFSQQLLQQLLGALDDSTIAGPRIGNAAFAEAQFAGDTGFSGSEFSGEACFAGARFAGSAGFGGARFSRNADFGGVRFSGDAVFGGARFSGDAGFNRAQFSMIARFREAQFAGDAWFRKARFAGSATFRRAQFAGSAVFRGARFCGDAWFRGAQFAGSTGFGRAQFAGVAWFRGARFAGSTRFSGTQVSGVARFSGARFETGTVLGPLVCGDALDLSAARFSSPVTVEAAAARVECRRTRWDSTAALRLRYATVDLSDAVVVLPLTVTARTARFLDTDGAVVSENGLAGMDPGVRLASLGGVDAAHLVLHDVDLSACRFSGTVHLDQLRLEGRCPLAPAPPGRRWTKRRSVAEEHHWRAAHGHAGWTAAPDGSQVVGPDTLAPVYRALRKSFEDSKNEPDAADFYYGEMEMRRHDRTRPRAERALLAVYWAVSGYGLRASRALSWLLVAMTATVLLMMLWGLPADAPKPATIGRLTGQDITLTTDTPAPVNPAGPPSSRLTSERWEKSLQVVVQSVVFRSADQDLTTAGAYTEMASRLAEPILLGLAALAIRGRVKR